MNLDAYVNAAVAGVPLTFVVFGLVWWYGATWPAVFKGRVQFISSMFTGLALGVLYFVSTTEPPIPGMVKGWEVYGYWFGASVYGLGLGVMASAGYEQGKDLVKSAVASQAEKLREVTRQRFAG